MSGGRLARVEQVVDQVRRWAPVYRRWWAHPCRQGSGGAPPWSLADEERWAWLGAIEPDRMAATAGELRRVSAELASHRADLAGLAADDAIPGPAALRCASLASAADERAVDAAVLAEAVDRAAQDVGWVLDAVARRVSQAAAALAETNPYPGPGPAHLAIDALDRLPPGVRPGPASCRSLDAFVDRHGVLLARLRAHLSDAVDRLGSGSRAGSDAWCDGDTGCTAAPMPMPMPAPASPPLAAPEPRPPASPAEVWMSQPWEPLPALPDSGPLLPGTEGTRPGTETGVRVAQLPDRPAGRAETRDSRC